MFVKLDCRYELWVLGALDEQAELTETGLFHLCFLIILIGMKMVSYPLEPSLSKIILSSIKFNCVGMCLLPIPIITTAEMLIIVALLSVPPIFFRPRERQEEADAAREKFFVPESDHLTLHNVYR